MKIDIFASGSGGNAYRISDGQTQLLLDAGIPYKEIQIGCDFCMTSLCGCLITHAHGDHVKAAKELLKRGTDVYTSQGTIDACGLSGHRVHAIKKLEEITIGTFQVLPFDVQHDAPEPLGFLVASSVTNEKLLYFTDTYYVKYKFSGLTHIMAECNYQIDLLLESGAKGEIPTKLMPRIIQSHMSLETLSSLLQANDLSNVKQIYLLHLSDNNSDAEAFKKTIQRLTGAEVYIA